MTEEEAKTKWCFHFIASHTDPRTPPSQYERDELGNASPFRHNCIGSACMAWRGKEQPGFARRAEIEFRQTGRRLTPTSADIDGYCGLAGAPQ